ncbi:MAG: LPS export ABC transporter permease LptG [Syntrophales bacterium]|nr:LPS export ABC transporter permease LptG [Syntrophales bacterium]
MKIIDRYILKQFLVSFAFLLVALTVCFLIVDFFSKIRMFLSNRASVSHILRYFYYLLPSIISHMIPASLLLSALVTFGNFSRFNEIVALKASGTSVYRLSLPILIFVLLATPFFFLFSEYIAPPAKDKADRLLSVEIKKQKMPGSFKQNQIWYRGNEGIYVFRLIDPKTLTLYGVTLHILDHQFHLKSIINAERAQWRANRWELDRVQIVSFSEENRILISIAPTIAAPISETPDELLMARKSPDRMGFRDLYRYVAKLKDDGYDTTPYRADLHGKIAFSFAGILLIPIGIIFGIRAERSGGLAQGMTLGAAIGFSYWLLFALFLSLGRAGTLPPWLAPWLSNIFFAFLGLFFARRIPT